MQITVSELVIVSGPVPRPRGYHHHRHLCAATPAAAEDATENLAEDINPGRIDGIIAGVHVARRVVLDRIDQRIQLLRVHDVALVVRATTRRVDTVSEEHDRFSSLDATQLLIDDHVDRVVEARAVVSPGAFNSALQALRRSVVNSLRTLMSSLNETTITLSSLTKLVDETDRRVLDVFESKLSGRARVEHQHDRERFVD